MIALDEESRPAGMLGRFGQKVCGVVTLKQVHRTYRTSDENCLVLAYKKTARRGAEPLPLQTLVGMTGFEPATP